ncbi:MAG TPA: BrnA antitoxin family protein [Pirellulales bacterium]
MNDSSRTDWDALARLSDDEIDYSDIPPLKDDFFHNAILHIPAIQARNLVQLDPDISEWFRAQGPDYQAVINSILRVHMSGG